MTTPRIPESRTIGAGEPNRQKLVNRLKIIL